MALPTSRVRATLMEDRPQAGVRGFLESARTWAADLVGTSRSRLDHFTSDVEERLFRLLARLMWTFVAFVCLSLGLLLAMLTVVFGFDLPPRYALGIPAVMLLLVGLVAVGVMRRKRGSKPARSEKHRRR